MYLFSYMGVWWKYMSNSNGGVGGALLEIVVGKLGVFVCVL